MNNILSLHFVPVLLLMGFPFLTHNDVEADAVYPESTFITGIEFNMSTVKNTCPGNGKKADHSDNWTITWADDGHQYTSWGDGGGFGGTNSDGRVSMGVARIEGSKDSYSGYNVWGGKDPESQATFTGKCYGIISINGILYLLRSGTKSVCYGLQELYKSTDHGKTWDSTEVRWEFPKTENTGFFVPTFLQFGKDYQNARDEYLYIYGTEHTESVNTDDIWAVNKPGKLVLIRVPKDSISVKSSYRYLCSLDNNEPQWTSDVNKRKPVFEDSQNGIMRTSVIYNQGIGRYILIAQHVTRFENLNGEQGYMGIYEAPEPWGPWSTILFEHPWSVGGFPHVQNADYPGDSKTVYWNFSPKWWSEEGKKFVMVYTGPGGDQWGTVEGQFILGE